jgi:subtilase family serine protease
VRNAGTTPPDLLGSYFNVIQEPLNAGNNFDVTYNIQNNGGTARDFNVKFYLSSNNYISSGDKLLDIAELSGLVANSSTGNQNIALTLPQPGDPFWQQQGDNTYYVGMMVDADNQVAESNENNNVNRGIWKDYDDVLVMLTGFSSNLGSIDIGAVNPYSPPPLVSDKASDLVGPLLALESPFSNPQNDSFL